jgi:hypothetical protein
LARPTGFAEDRYEVVEVTCAQNRHQSTLALLRDMIPRAARDVSAATAPAKNTQPNNSLCVFRRSFTPNPAHTTLSNRPDHTEYGTAPNRASTGPHQLVQPTGRGRHREDDEYPAIYLVEDPHQDLA